MKYERSQLLDLTPSDIDLLIDDLNLQLQGAKLHYAIDPKEIFDFCFPINPHESRFREFDINRIADNQAALYEIFYVRNERPLMLLEYAQELKRVLSFMTRSVDRVYTEVEMLNELISLSGLEALSSEQWHVDANPELTLDKIQSDFNIILAVIMGIYSIGVNRFNDILNRRIAVENLDNVDSTATQIFRNYAESALPNTIVESLSRSSTERSDDLLQEERRKRADRVDSYAIDKIIYLNNAFEQAYLKFKDAEDSNKQAALKNRHVILYLSTAQKSKRIFKLDAVQQALPIIDNKQYSVWRTRAQIFAYVVHKSEHTDEHERTAETITNLSKVREVLSEIEKLKSVSSSVRTGCGHCVLDGKNGEHCELQEYCSRLAQINIQNVKASIKRREAQVRNLGLVNTLSSYQELTRKDPKGEFKNYVDFFKELYKSERLRDIATERMELLQWLILTTSEFTNAISGGLKLKKELFLRANRDSITATAQYLPTRPHITSLRYQRILELVLSYYKTPLQGGFKREELFYDAYKEFLEIDTTIVEFNLEHELMRCLLYLAIPTVIDETKAGKVRNITGDEKAYKHALQIISNKELFRSHPDIEKEYYYVICWAARRVRNYEQANYFAGQSITEWREDARFYHARCLNTYSWLSDKDEKDKCPLTIMDAIHDCLMAIQLYLRANDTELTAVNYNNLAYFWSMEYSQQDKNTKSSKVAITEARVAVDRLKSLIPPSDWTPNFPEYFHTEAFVEYYEFLYLSDQRKPIKTRIKKLQHAKKAMDNAVLLLRGVARPASYRVLKRSIQRSLSSLYKRSASKTQNLNKKATED